MLFKARNTEYGMKYGFDDILISKNPVEEYRKRVPLVTYSQMHDLWIRQYNGEANITWPGRCTHFALSSGTTEGASKYIPVTDDQLKADQSFAPPIAGHGAYRCSQGFSDQRLPYAGRLHGSQLQWSELQR
jgi:hypothetical protein